MNDDIRIWPDDQQRVAATLACVAAGDFDNCLDAVIEAVASGRGGGPVPSWPSAHVAALTRGSSTLNRGKTPPRRCDIAHPVRCWPSAIAGHSDSEGSSIALLVGSCGVQRESG